MTLVDTRSKDADKADIKSALEQLASQRWNFRSLDDWYKRSSADVSKANSALLHRYEGSLLRALTDLYPEHTFKFWKFKEAPLRLWRVRKNQRDFFEDFSRSKAFSSLEGFYAVTRNDVLEHGGEGLMEIFGNSVSAAVMAAYPEYKWQLFRFDLVPKNYWSNTANALEYLAWLRNKLNLTSTDDWYKVTRRNFVDNGGSKLIAMNKDSVSLLLKKYYPNHSWDDSKFQNITLSFEDDQLDKKEFLRAIEDKFQIKGPEDWYRISMEQIHESGGKSVFPNRPALVSELKGLYPFFHWDESRFNGYFGRLAHWWLRQALADLFPGEEIAEDHRFNELVVADRSRVIPESLGLYLPGLKLAFEYLNESSSSNISAPRRTGLDPRKKEVCATAGITLIGVPFWWRRDLSSLVRAITTARPDLNNQLIAPPETVNYLMKLHSLRQPPSLDQEDI